MSVLGQGGRGAGILHPCHLFRSSEDRLGVCINLETFLRKVLQVSGPDVDEVAGVNRLTNHMDQNKNKK